MCVIVVVFSSNPLSYAMHSSRFMISIFSFTLYQLLNILFECWIAMRMFIIYSHRNIFHLKSKLLKIFLFYTIYTVYNTLFVGYISFVRCFSYFFFFVFSFVFALIPSQRTKSALFKLNNQNVIFFLTFRYFIFLFLFWRFIFIKCTYTQHTHTHILQL